MTQPNPVNYDLAAHRVSSGQWRVDPDQGLVYGKRGLPFRRTNSWGYIQIKFRDPDNWRVEHAALAHRVIWESVHGPLSGSLTINHINGDKADNRIDNLEALTLGDNVRHAQRTGLRPVRIGEDNANSRLTAAAVRDIYERAWAGQLQTGIADAHHISREVVSNIKQGWSWSHVTGHRRVG